MNIYIYNKESGIPKDDTCYLIGKKGPYLKKTLDLISSLTPVDKISFLDEVPTYAEMNIPKIPIKMISHIIGFFKEIYSMYKTESIVLLYYNKDKKSYQVYVPEQTVSQVKLDYKCNISIKDHILIGTIHSHASMSAFHSSVDLGDEEKFDGIHLTIGKLDQELFDICGSIAINGMRVPIVPEDYIDGIECREYTPFFPTMFRPKFNMNIYNEKNYINNVKPSIGYTLKDSSDIDTFNIDWLKKVKERKVQIPTIFHFNSQNGLNKSITQTNFNFGNPNKNLYNKDEGCICSKCIHRCKKLELQDTKLDDKELLEDHFDDDFWWEGGW